METNKQNDNDIGASRKKAVIIITAVTAVALILTAIFLLIPRSSSKASAPAESSMSGSDLSSSEADNEVTTKYTTSSTAKTSAVTTAKTTTSTTPDITTVSETTTEEQTAATEVTQETVPDVTEAAADNKPEYVFPFDTGVSEQLITVESSGSSCTVRLYQKDGGVWDRVYETYGAVGRNGVSEKSQEGDYRTPKGVFSLGFAFGTQRLDDLSIEYRTVNANCYWVDDPLSPYYNMWVESDTVSWQSAEHLIDYPNSYKYAVAINYNTDPIIPYKGSAIFLHCMTASYTAGCVSVPEADMLYILKWLDSAKHPIISIS